MGIERYIERERKKEEERERERENQGSLSDKHQLLLNGWM